jgi:hypothetical protein
MTLETAADFAKAPQLVVLDQTTRGRMRSVPGRCRVVIGRGNGTGAEAWEWAAGAG